MDYKPFMKVMENMDEAVKNNAPVQVVKLENGKLGVYIRQNGKFEPFMYRGVETGFYDLRINTNQMEQWDTAFHHIKLANANTVEFLIHVLDIEPEEGRFDWTVTDKVIELAERNDLKIRFVYFTSLFTGQHLKFNLYKEDLNGNNTLVNVPDHKNPWLYGNADSIQWSFNKYTGEIQASSYMDYFNKRIPIYLCYTNPYVNGAVQNNFKRLVERYKSSAVVVGYQVTNEEGIQWRWPNGDANPHTAKDLKIFLKEKYSCIEKLNEDWETSYYDFEKIIPQMAPYDKWGDYRRELVARYIKGLMKAGHEADPYKPFFMNIFAGEEVLKDGGLYNNTATDAKTYSMACTDGVAAMLYRPGYRDKTVLNRICDDLNINAPTDVLLATTELGIGTRYWDIENQFAFNVYQYLQRGGQGYAAYDWGEFVTPVEDINGQPNEVLHYYKGIADIVEQNQDVLFYAIPVDTVVPEKSKFRITTDTPYFEITTLKRFYKDSNMIGLVYNYSTNTRYFEIIFNPAETGKYNVTFYQPNRRPVEKVLNGVFGEKVHLRFSDLPGKIFGILRIVLDCHL